MITELPDSRIRTNLKLVARNARRLSRLVDSLMDFSKLAANKLEGAFCALVGGLSHQHFSLGHFQPVHLGIFTADLASLFRSLIERSGIKVIFTLPFTG